MRPVLKGRYVRKISILFDLIVFSTWRKDLILKNPLKNSHDLSALLRSELGYLKLPRLIEGISMTISDFVGEYGVQYRAFTGIRDDIRDRKNKLIAVWESKLQSEFIDRKYPISLNYLNDIKGFSGDSSSEGQLKFIFEHFFKKRLYIVIFEGVKYLSRVSQNELNDYCNSLEASIKQKQGTKTKQKTHN